MSAKLRTSVCESALNKWEVNHKASESGIPSSGPSSHHGLCECQETFGGITWVEGSQSWFQTTGGELGQLSLIFSTKSVKVFRGVRLTVC